MEKTYCNILKNIRLSKDKTQSEMAQELKIGRTSYTKIETGKQEFDIETAIRVADYFGITLDQLFGREILSENKNFDAVEMAHIKKYRQLNADSKKEVESFIDFKLKLQNEKNAAIRSTVV